MALDPHDLPDDVLAFLADYHLATLTTRRPDGSPVSPSGMATITTSAQSESRAGMGTPMIAWSME